MKWLNGILLWVFLVSIPVRGNDAQFWFQATTNINVGTDWVIFAEAQPRVSFLGDASNLMLLRAALGYKLHPDASVWLGYAFAPVLTPTYREEHRPWAQYLFGADWGDVRWTLRGRLEARFFGGGSPVTAYRLRAMVRASYPAQATLQATVYEEVFLHFAEAPPVAAAGFDQNRLFLGATWGVAPSLSIDTGYLLQILRRLNLPERWIHAAVITTAFRF